MYLETLFWVYALSLIGMAAVALAAGMFIFSPHCRAEMLQDWKSKTQHEHHNNRVS